MLNLRRPHLLPTAPIARREARWGLLFISPWIVGFILFALLPLIAAMVLTFTNITVGQQDPVRFVGLENYQRLLNDKRAWDSLTVSLRFAIIALPVGVLLPFAVALLLHSRYLKAAGLFRVLFFLPYVVPFVAGVLIWQSMLGPDTGWINQGLRLLGIKDTPNWLSDTVWVYPSLVIIGLWGIGSGIVVYLAGLRGVPTELYDAAAIDGAGCVATLRHVTVPLMSPVIFYTLILGIVEVLQYFLVPLVLNNATGEPGGTTLFFNIHLYQTFVLFKQMSYGATLAWFLFAITLVIALIVFRSARRWVYYAGDADRG